VDHARVAHLAGFGVADPSGHPVTLETPFFLGSASKSFTALAVMQLVEKGQIELGALILGTFSCYARFSHFPPASLKDRSV
jgi:CubicO group peptidase (beta-lactamase class C family)